MLFILINIDKINKGTAGLKNKSCLAPEPLAESADALRTNEAVGTDRGDVLPLHLAGGES